MLTQRFVIESNILIPASHPRQALFLINNKISKIHPKAFKNMDRLRLLYLSYNLLTEIPANLPRNILELRFHENRIARIKRDAFRGLRSLNVLGNDLWAAGVQSCAKDEPAGFQSNHKLQQQMERLERKPADSFRTGHHEPVENTDNSDKTTARLLKCHYWMSTPTLCSLIADFMQWKGSF